MKIKATSVNLEDDGYCTVLGFADSPVDPQQYVVLQVTNSPSPQDLQLGQGGVHLELGEQGLSGYDLLTAIEMKGNCVLLTIDDTEARKGGVDSHLLIELAEPSIDGQTTAEAIKIFQARLHHI